MKYFALVCLKLSQNKLSLQKGTVSFYDWNSFSINWDQHMINTHFILNLIVKVQWTWLGTLMIIVRLNILMFCISEFEKWWIRSLWKWRRFMRIPWFVNSGCDMWHSRVTQGVGRHGLQVIIGVTIVFLSYIWKERLLSLSKPMIDEPMLLSTFILDSQLLHSFYLNISDTL